MRTSKLLPRMYNSPEGLARNSNSFAPTWNRYELAYSVSLCARQRGLLFMSVSSYLDLGGAFSRTVLYGIKMKPMVIFAKIVNYVQNYFSSNFVIGFFNGYESITNPAIAINIVYFDEQAK